MAFITGTASDHLDLAVILRDFLTSNVELVSAGQNWEIMDDASTTLPVSGPVSSFTPSAGWTFKAPGLSGDKSIYVHIGCAEDVPAEHWYFFMRGHGGHLPTMAEAEQPLRSAASYLPFWNQPMTYWIAGDGQHVRIVLKVSTVFPSSYLGFIVPYDIPDGYPYPLLIAGQTRNVSDRWSTVHYSSRFIANPGYGTARLYCPDNQWRELYNWGTSSNSGKSFGPCFVVTTHHSSSAYAGVHSGWQADEPFMLDEGPAQDGSYVPRPLEIMTTSMGRATLGVLDGYYKVAGRGNSAENIIVKDGVDYLVVPDLFRTGFADYMAMRLA